MSYYYEQNKEKAKIFYDKIVEAIKNNKRHEIPSLRFLFEFVDFCGDKDELHRTYGNLLKAASSNGLVDVVKFLVEDDFCITIKDIDRTCCICDSADAFERAAINGHVNILKYFTKTFGLTAHHFSRIGGQYILAGASENGHIPVLKYLKDTFSLGPKDVLKSYAHGWAIKGGRPDVLMFFRDEFGVSAESMRMEAVSFIGEIVSDGSVSMLESLALYCAVTTANVCAKNNFAIKIAAKWGRVDMMRCLKDNFGVCLTDAEKTKMIEDAKCSGYKNVIKELDKY